MPAPPWPSLLSVPHSHSLHSACLTLTLPPLSATLTLPSQCLPHPNPPFPQCCFHPFISSVSLLPFSSPCHLILIPVPPLPFPSQCHLSHSRHSATSTLPSQCTFSHMASISASSRHCFNRVLINAYI